MESDGDVMSQALSMVQATVSEIQRKPEEASVPPKRVRPRPETKLGLVDTFTINFLQRFADDADRFHGLLIQHLDGTRVLDANQTRVLLRILDIVHEACADIELHTQKSKSGPSSAKPPAPAMRS
jgi:hypothetical protein